MKVVLIYRSSSRGRFSIENVFSSIAPDLAEEADLAESFLSSKWGSLRDLVALWRMRADVYHITGDVQYLAMLLPRGRVVLTVHDTSHLQFNKRGLRRLLYRLLWFDLPLACASQVTVISEATRQSVSRLNRRLEDRLSVVPNAVSPVFAKCRQGSDSDKPRLLFLGTAEHKNLDRAIEAIVGLSCTLVVVGELEPRVQQRAQDLGVDLEVFRGLDIDQVYREYCQASLVLFPSLREGFGLPILEAQSVGRPVITSNLSPMREVAGAGACLVDPVDVASIAAGVSRVLTDAGYRRQLVEAGWINVERYRTKSVSGQYLAVYARVASCSGG